MAKQRVAVIGGGVAGLVAAYELSKSDAHVTLFEQAAQLGGLAASFEIEDGNWLERYYHFICKPDRPYFEMLRELGLSSRVRWVTTRMGLFYDGGLYTLGDPISLLLFPKLSVADKMRFCWSTLLSKFCGSEGWRSIEDISARDWLVQHYGERTYEVLYKPLLELKFREYAPTISAAWMWSRINRLGNSRTITQQERLGYLDGGTQVYLGAIEQAMRARGAEIRTRASVERIVIESGRVVAVECDGKRWPCDCAVSTVPLPVARKLFGEAQGPYFDNLRRLESIGVMVMVLRIKRQFSKYFWMNISDRRLSIPGVIEYTNLNPCRYLGGDAILYVLQYLSHAHPLCSTPNEDLLKSYVEHLRLINPQFGHDWVRQYWVHRDPYAQPICSVGFSRHVPSMQTPIKGLFLTDSYQLHPHDRTIANSTDLGRKVARLVLSRISP